VACAAGAQQAPPGSTTAGADSFATRCAVCHGGDGNGSERGPSLLGYVAAHPDEQIAALIRSGVRAMPAHDIANPEMTGLLAFLHTLRVPEAAQAPSRRSVTLASGETLIGSVLNETRFNLQLATDDGRIHLLTRDGDALREPSVLPKQDWPRYDGSLTASRNSE